MTSMLSLVVAYFTLLQCMVVNNVHDYIVLTTCLYRLAKIYEIMIGCIMPLHIHLLAISFLMMVSKARYI